MPAGETPFFLEVPGGQRLCIHAEPTGRLRGAIVYLHPLTEEMNKSRRMAALQRQALANTGFAVLAIDLFGCGDSSGEFEDATWSAWIDDALRAADWLRTRYSAPLWLWGLRAGCLLACSAAGRLISEGRSAALLFWQPPSSGKALLQQLLRTRLAAGLRNPASASARDDGRADLAAGRTVEVAGYRLGAVLAADLARAELTAPTPSGPAVWLEVSSREPAALMPSTAAHLQAWQRAGHDVRAQAVAGPAFWQTQEIELAPALITATSDALCAAMVPT